MELQFANQLMNSYGDRSARVRDKWNNQWWLATHKADVGDQEMERRKDEFQSKGKNKANP